MKHFGVWLEEYFLQPLQMTCVKKMVPKMKKKNTYPISFVECLGHDILAVRDEAIKTKQAWGFLQKKTRRPFQ